MTPTDRLILTDAQVRNLAADFGTPLYVISESVLRSKLRSYREAFAAAWPKSKLTFASKSNSTLAVLKIAHEEGLLIDVASEGELRAAMLAGVPASDCHLHGNNKTVQELKFAVEAGVGEIVVDSFEEIAEISLLDRPLPHLILRLAPGVNPKTNEKISTGQADTKFGFNIVDGSAERALALCLSHDLPVKGFHCHVGSQLLDPTAQINGGEIITAFALEMLAKHGFRAEVLNVGGGMGIRYQESDAPMPVEEYCQKIAEGIRLALEGSGLDPVLMQEPGRSIVGEAGVTLYRVGVVKEVPTRTFVAVDGGLSDNPRPALYGSPYTVLMTTFDGRPKLSGSHFTVSGKHCETDRLFAEIKLPSDIQRGDWLQVLSTGAYNSSMASNYNRYQRPATVLLREDGTPIMVQRPETWDEMFAREILP